MYLIANQHMKSINALYTLQMRYLLSTLDQIPKYLEEMIDAASDHQLREAFRSQLNGTGFQRERVEQILIELTNQAVAARCPITAALIGVAEKIVRATDGGSVRDAWLAASAHKMEEFEIASYETALQWALALGHASQAPLLETTLREKQRADDFLRSIGERINPALTAAT